jgi:hypothetical protein
MNERKIIMKKEGNMGEKDYIELMIEHFICKDDLNMCCDFDGRVKTISETVKRILMDYIIDTIMKSNDYRILSWQEFSRYFYYAVEKLSEICNLDVEDMKEARFLAYAKAHETFIYDKWRYFSWDDFKRNYLALVEELGQLLGIVREGNAHIHEGRIYENYANRFGIDDDWIFVDRVLTCISECEDESERGRLILKLKECAGSRDLFDEIYRKWVFKKYCYCSNGDGYPAERLRRAFESSEIEERNIFDILTVTHDGEGFGVGYWIKEDFEENVRPITIKIRHNSYMTAKQIVEALQYAVRLYEEYFTNYSYSPEYTEVYEEGWEKQYYSMPIGLLKANRAIGRAYSWGYISKAAAMKLVGWIDPEVSLNTGIDEILQRAWPELYESVLEGKMTPFEALLKTGWVHPKELFDVLGKGKEIQSLVEETFPPDKWVHRKSEVNEPAESDEDLLQDLEDV